MSNRRVGVFGSLPSTHKETKVINIQDKSAEYLDRAKEKTPKMKEGSRFIYLKALELACADLVIARQEIAFNRMAMLYALMEKDTDYIENFLYRYHKHLGREDALSDALAAEGTDPSPEPVSPQSEGASSAVRGHDYEVSVPHTRKRQGYEVLDEGGECEDCGRVHKGSCLDWHGGEPESPINCPNCETPLGTSQVLPARDYHIEHFICHRCGYEEHR